MEKRLKNNYHTHCRLCGHAEGDVIDFVDEAVKTGMKTIGMSDHVPYREDDYNQRMPYDRLEEYYSQVALAKSTYGGRINILTGFECEYIPGKQEQYEALLMDERVDYLIQGQHFFWMQDGRLVNCFETVSDTCEYPEYAKACVEGMKSGLFAYLAHPDLVFLNCLKEDDNTRRAIDIIIEGAIKYGAILEINANGFRRGIREYPEGSRYPYPMDRFWEEVAKTEITAIVGSDCHNRALLNDEYVEMALNYAREKNIKLTDSIK